MPAANSKYYSNTLTYMTRCNPLPNRIMAKITTVHVYPATYCREQSLLFDDVWLYLYLAEIVSFGFKLAYFER